LVLAARIEALLKDTFKDKIPKDLLSKPFLLPEENISNEKKKAPAEKERLRRSNHYIPGNDPNMF